MAAPVNPDALANALQALSAVLQTFRANTPAAPSAAAPAVHVNILDAFESVNPFDLGYRAGSYFFPKQVPRSKKPGTEPLNNSLPSSSVFVSVHPKIVGIPQHLMASLILLGRNC